MPPDTAFTEAELADIENWAKQDLLAGNLGQQANARRMLRLVDEVRWYRGFTRSRAATAREASV